VTRGKLSMKMATPHVRIPAIQPKSAPIEPPHVLIPSSRKLHLVRNAKLAATKQVEYNLQLVLSFFILFLL